MLALSALVACNTLEVLPDLNPGPYENYARSLRRAELGDTRLGASWLQAGDLALREAELQVTSQPLPFEEVLFFDPAEPRAVVYSLNLVRGQRLEAYVTLPEIGAGQVFLELFAIQEGAAPERVAEAEEGTVAFVFEVDEPGRFLLRLQPELLVGGPHALRVVTAGRLDFPVAEGSVSDVGSRFGDPRDGGSRSHAGVDIFAPRGTPVVAASSGVVTRVGNNRLGGKVVWMRTSEGHSLYYAHLDEQSVRTGTRVAAGDVLGRVGNTGNARNTPPHLHFGLYDGQAVDPLPFLQPRRQSVPVSANLERLGTWGRVRSDRVNFRRGPSVETEILSQLPRGTAIEILGAQRDWYRGVLPDGTAGYIFAPLTEPADVPLRALRLTDSLSLANSSRIGAIVLAELPAGSELAVLGDFAGHLLVRTGEGKEGWIQLS